MEGYNLAGQKTTEKRATEKSTAKMEALKIGYSVFSNYTESEQAYIEKWEKHIQMRDLI